MTQLTVETRYAASPERTFEVFADIHHAAESVQGIQSLEVLTDGPVGVGTRFRETRKMFGKEATEEMWFTAFEPGRSYTVEAESHGAHYTSVYRFEPEGDGTRVRMTFEIQALSLGAKLMTPLSFLMKGSLRKLLAKDMEDLRPRIEATTAS